VWPVNSFMPWKSSVVKLINNLIRLYLRYQNQELYKRRQAIHWNFWGIHLQTTPLKVTTNLHIETLLQPHYYLLNSKVLEWVCHKQIQYLPQDKVTIYPTHDKRTFAT
jgi:hypothetical protein